MTPSAPVSMLLDVDNALGHYALDSETLAGYPPADVALDSIADLLRFDLPALLQAAQAGRSTAASGSFVGERP